MIFCSGDLIRVPSNIALHKINNNYVEFYKKTERPKMGIFVNYENSNECVVNVDGENWVVPLQHIRILEGKVDKISTNK